MIQQEPTSVAAESSPYVSIWADDYRPGGFSEEMENLHGFLWFYAFVRKGQSRRIQRGFVREVEAPYRWGRGLQLRAFSRVWGFGLCRKHKFPTEDEALDEALEAEWLDDPANEIGDW